MRSRYTFNVGLFEGSPICIVEADTLKQAYDKAREQMDRRYAEAGKEPPVAWTFVLLQKEPIDEARTPNAKTDPG
jgi:hypothetical protein